MSAELSVDEMIVATINSSKGLDERVRNQMIAWVKCAADFGGEVDQLAEQNRNLRKEKCELLGIIQQKDELIRKMRNCHNCKNFVEYLGCVKIDETNGIIAQKKQRICRLPGQCKNNELWEIRI